MEIQTQLWMTEPKRNGQRKAEGVQTGSGGGSGGGSGAK